MSHVEYAILPKERPIMAKRYGNSKVNHHKDKFNDEMKHDKDSTIKAMYRRAKVNDGFYEGPEPRRMLEMKDAGMLYEDHNAIANLPQDVKIKPYPKTGPYMPEMLNDDLSGVDAQMDYDDSQRRAHMYPKKV